VTIHSAFLFFIFYFPRYYLSGLTAEITLVQIFHLGAGSILPYRDSQHHASQFIFQCWRDSQFLWPVHQKQDVAYLL
jgi:hypothetical protein